MPNSSFQICDRVRAVFNPTRTDNLRPGMEAWIGREDIWECNGEADPDGPYAGQASFQIATNVVVQRAHAGVPFEEWRPPCTWIPEEDLEVIGAKF